MSDLVQIADGLYAATPADFTALRDAAAKEAGREDGKPIKTLKKPSVAAWALNLLVRREADQIEQVLSVGASLREAATAMDGDELRALTRQRRQLTTALASTARALAREHDVRLTGPVVDQVEGMLNAAMLDPVAAEVVRSGMVLTAFTSTGVSELDVSALVALPEALGHVAAPVARAAPTLRVVPEDDSLKREKADLALEAATATHRQAKAQLQEVERSLKKLTARRLQLAEERDELRRRLSDLDDEMDGVEEQIEETEESRDDAVTEVDEADAARERARQARAELGSAQ